MMDSDTYDEDYMTQTRQAELTAANIAIVILTVIFVGFRFYSRWIKGVKFGVDDYGVLLALCFLFLLLAMGQVMIHHGLGLHFHALSLDDLLGLMKGLLAFECLYVATITTIKISVLLMYCRAFDVRSVRISALVLGGIAIAWAIAIVLVCIFQCTPISKAWEPMIDGYCIDLKGYFVGNAVPNILTDVAILALPIRQVWKMHEDWRVRLQLLIIFSLGSFVVFTSIYRFTTLFQFVPDDATWTLATCCTWSIIECAAGIISVCLPTLSPLVQCLFCTNFQRKSKSNTAGGKTSIHTSGLSYFHRLESRRDVEMNGGLSEIERREEEAAKRAASAIRLDGTVVRPPLKVHPSGKSEFEEI